MTDSASGVTLCYMTDMSCVTLCCMNDSASNATLLCLTRRLIDPVNLTLDDRDQMKHAFLPEDTVI